MGFKILYGDICKMKTDAIVNSLGVDSEYLGSICKDILNKSQSKEVLDLVQSNKNNNVFDIFVTDAGFLPSRHIIHIVSPFKHLDDENNSALKKAYRLVIEEAIKRKYKSISIPFLGTGANGYYDTDVYTAATEVARDYITAEEVSGHEKIDINLIIYDKNPMLNPKELNYRMQYRIRFWNDNRSLSIDGGPNYNVSKSIMDTVELNSIFSLVNKNDMFIPEDYVTCVVDFIDSYMKQNKIKPIVLHSDGISKDKMSKCRLGKRIFRKNEIFRTGIILGWNRTVFLQAMAISGYSFSPLIDTDVWFNEYLLENNLVVGINKFMDLYPEMLPVLFDHVK